jgi:SAM-dependent MidA family methyltransferase
VLARALDCWWDELGRPDPFVVVEAGAGAGTLAAAVIEAEGACAPALRYVTVERSDRLRAAQGERLALELPAVVLGPVIPAGDDDEGRLPVAGLGPLVTALAELPAGPVDVVLANELLDNLPFLLLEHHGGGRWLEVRVGEAGAGFTEVLVPAAADLAAEATRLAPDAPEGARIPIQAAAQAWLRAALNLVDRGRVVALDYATSTPELARRPWSEWVRTYRSHSRGGPPLDGAGTQDITCEVAVDQLARVAPPAADRPQAEFLDVHGLGELTAAAQDRWEAAAAAPDLGALRARSTVAEARTLADPGGLGAFRVLEWARGRP